MSESTQHKLDRVRPPRVQITYDVETGGATVMKELPMIVGIMSDLSGHRDKPMPKLKDRKFVQIDRDNFNDVLGSIEPHLKFAVDNKLSADGGRLGVELRFKGIEDFEPAKVVEQVPALKAFLQARQRLVDLLGKLDGNDELAQELRQAAASGGLEKIRSELSST